MRKALGIGAAALAVAGLIALHSGGDMTGYNWPYLAAYHAYDMAQATIFGG